MPDRKKKRLPSLFWLVLRPLAAAAVVGGLCVYVIAFYRMSSNNMYPNVKDGDLCICYRLAQPRVRDVVLYTDEKGEARIGRIIAIPGQTVDFPEGQGCTVDTYLQQEEIPFETKIPDEKKDAFPITLRENEYFIMNDYRADQKDGRTYGALERSFIRGTVIFVLRGRGI